MQYTGRQRWYEQEAGFIGTENGRQAGERQAVVRQTGGNPVTGMAVRQAGKGESGRRASGQTGRGQQQTSGQAGRGWRQVSGQAGRRSATGE